MSARLLEFKVPRVARGQSRLVYIAAPFSQREEALKAKTLLEAAGHVITSSWITSHLEDYDGMPSEVAAAEAALDLEAIRRCEVVLLLNNVGPSTSGGMHIEVGYGIAAGKGLLIVGEPTTIFYHLPNVRLVRELPDVLDALTRYFTPQPKQGSA